MRLQWSGDFHYVLAANHNSKISPRVRKLKICLTSTWLKYLRFSADETLVSRLIAIKETNYS